MEYLKGSELLEIERDYELLLEFSTSKLDKGLSGHEILAAKYRIYFDPKSYGQLIVIGQFDLYWSRIKNLQAVIQYFLKEELELWKTSTDESEVHQNYKKFGMSSEQAGVLIEL